MDALTAVLFDRVQFGYGAHPVLEDVGFGIRLGESVGLFGANGAGKTTITRLVIALQHPSSGLVRTLDRDTAGLGPEDFASQVGYLFQYPEAQLFARSVADEIAFGLHQQRWPTHRIQDRVEHLLTVLGLDRYGTTHPYDLPAPLRRIVALGTALAAEPRVLLLDEPTAGLDRESRSLVSQTLRGFQSEGGAVLAVTHDAEFAAECLDRGLVLGGGRIIEDLPILQVLLDADRHGIRCPGDLETIIRLGLTVSSPNRKVLAEALTAHFTNRDPEHGNC